MSEWVAPDPGPRPVGDGRAAGLPGSAALARPAPVAAFAPVRLQPRTTVQLLDASCRVLHRQGRTIVPIVLVVALPLEVGVTLLQRSVGLDRPAVLGTSIWDLGTALDGGQVAVSYLAVALQSLVLAVLGVAIAPIVTADHFGRTPTIGASLRLAARRLPAVLVAWFLAKVALVFGGCLLLGSLVVIVWTLVVSPVIAIEGLGPVKALARSISLTSRRWMSCLGVVLLTALVSTVVGAALSALPLLVGLLGPFERFDWVLGALASVLATVIVVPIVCGTATLAYLDLRVRTEGLDLQMELDRG